MKKALFLFSATTFLFSYTITDTKTYMEKIEPLYFKTSLKVIISQKNLNTLINLLNTNTSKLKPYCQNVDYSFTPVYRYVNKTEVFETYKAYINALCIFKKEKIKNFSKTLNSLKESKIRLNSFESTIKKSEQEKTISKLKTDAYKDILKEAKQFSEKLNKKCFATNIKIYAPSVKQTRPKPVYRMKTLSENAPLPIPKNDRYIKITADYQIECY